MSDCDNKKAVGCFLMVLTLLILMPIWYAVMIGLLLAADAPMWTWVMFWLYVPVSFILGIAKAIIGELA